MVNNNGSVYRKYTITQIEFDNINTSSSVSVINYNFFPEQDISKFVVKVIYFIIHDCFKTIFVSSNRYIRLYHIFKGNKPTKVIIY